MYCTKCGNFLNNQAEVCPECNTKAVSPVIVKKETSVLAIIALVFSVLCPFVGFYLGMVASATYESKKLKDLSSFAITISVGLFALLCVATLILFYFI